MHQALGIVLIVLFVLACVVIGLFFLSVIEEERSKMRNGGYYDGVWQNEIETDKKMENRAWGTGKCRH